VPAEAVIREPQALSGITGRKGCVGGRVSPVVKSHGSTVELRRIRRGLRAREVCGTHGVGVKSVDIVGNTKSEGSTLVRP